MTHTKLKIEGMHCGSCAAGIQMVLAATEGVKSATIHYDAQEGEVEFDEEKTKPVHIAEVVSALGYRATPLE